MKNSHFAQNRGPGKKIKCPVDLGIPNHTDEYTPLPYTLNCQIYLVSWQNLISEWICQDRNHFINDRRSIPGNDIPKMIAGLMVGNTAVQVEYLQRGLRAVECGCKISGHLTRSWVI
jgi:hypothetical protein